MHAKDQAYFQSLFTTTSLDDAQLQVIVAKISLYAFNKTFKHQAIFNNRLKTTGGRYHLVDHHLDFNPKVFEKYGWQELVNVILHELCHYHLHLAKSGYQHKDQAFKQLLKEVGGTRYVKTLVDETSAKIIYQCSQCQGLFPRVRAINTNRYRCKCQGQLMRIK